MKRSSFLRVSSTEAHLSVPVLKPRKCKQCKETYQPYRPMQAACGPQCAQCIAAKKKALEQAKERRSEAKADRVKREELKTLPKLLKEAQIEFNSFVRARDAGRTCICCGLPLSHGDIGGGFDAGHYRSVGSAPHLRFSEQNCHAQRKVCNRWGGGRAVDYRLGLIQRIGLAAVEALESDQTLRKYTRDELRGLRDHYRAKVKTLKLGSHD